MDETMPSRLHALAAAHGIQCVYLDCEDRQVRVEDRTLEALLAALGVDPSAPPPTPAEAGPVETDATCHIPGFLEAGPAWGVACQKIGRASWRESVCQNVSLSVDDEPVSKYSTRYTIKSIRSDTIIKI